MRLQCSLNHCPELSYTKKFSKKYFQNLKKNNIHVGRSGVLFHPSFFHKTGNLIFREDMYTTYCKTNDDIWFNLIRVCNNVKCYIKENKWYKGSFT